MADLVNPDGDGFVVCQIGKRSSASDLVMSRRISIVNLANHIIVTYTASFRIGE
jgi:hypothetical protein